MKKETKPPRSKKHLDEEEHLLWEHTTQTIRRIKHLKPRVGTSEFFEDGVLRRIGASVDRKDVATRVPAPESASPIPPRKSAPTIAEFDRKKMRKIGSGKIEIDARIDLHGLTQSEAHAALSRFLHRAAANDKRHVLIVTGKGSSQRRDHDDTIYGSEMRSGVLRRNVPRWLEEPDLRPLVVSYTTAAIRHGGEGALYVHLRTKKT